MDISRIYTYALQREIEGKRFFDENASRLSHAAAVSAFKMLAGEEQKHIEFIQGHLHALTHGGPLPVPPEQPTLEATGYFTQRAESEFIDQTITEAMVPDLPILRMAYLIERDFAEFYEQASSRAEGEAVQVLQMLAGWERGHERFFRALHDRAFDEYAQMPWGG